MGRNDLLIRTFLKIETVSGAKVEFSREVFIWDELNQFERDDIISLLVNGNDDAQAVISVSTGYTLSWSQGENEGP